MSEENTHLLIIIGVPVLIFIWLAWKFFADPKNDMDENQEYNPQKVKVLISLIDGQKIEDTAYSSFHNYMSYVRSSHSTVLYVDNGTAINKKHIVTITQIEETEGDEGEEQW